MSEKKEIVEKFIFNDEVQDLLEQISNNVMDFNLLEITGMGTQEIKHSNILSWMFGDNEHNLGYKILEGFLKKVIDENNDNGFLQDEQKELLKHYVYLPDNTRNFTIFREKNSIDLLLIDENNKVAIAIENKVYTSERSDGADGGQLNKYFTYVKKKYANFKRFYIYLTLDNSSPSKGNESNWLVASHQMIGEVVEQLLGHNSINEKTHLILSSYVDLLKRRNIMEDKELEKLCEKIWTKNKNSKALDILYRYRKTEIDKLYLSITEDKRIHDLGRFANIKTRVHDKLSNEVYKSDWEDAEENTLELQINKFKSYIWFGYWHPDATTLIKTNENYKNIYKNLFKKDGEKITKEHKILIIEEDELYNGNYEEILEKCNKLIQQEIEKFENIVNEALSS